MPKKKSKRKKTNKIPNPKDKIITRYNTFDNNYVRGLNDVKKHFKNKNLDIHPRAMETALIRCESDKLIKAYSEVQSEMLGEDLFREDGSVNPKMAPVYNVIRIIEGTSRDWYHHKYGKVVIFPQNKSLLTNLVNSTFNIKNAIDSISFKSFTIALPKYFSVDGKRIDSIQVTFNMPHDKNGYKIKYRDEYLPAADLADPENLIGDMLVCSEKGEMFIDYISLGNRMSFSLPLAELDKVLNGNYNIDLSRECIGDSLQKHDIDIIKLVLGLNLYIKTFPCKLVSGYKPSGLEKYCVYSIKALRESESSSNSKQSVIQERGTVTPHFRSWTFRTLRHDKFKKNEDGSNKIVFVKGCWVNNKSLDTKTLVE